MVLHGRYAYTLIPGCLVGAHHLILLASIQLICDRLAVILINVCEYGVPKVGIWLLHVMEVMFWAYVALSVSASAGMYLILWSTL